MIHSPAVFVDGFGTTEFAFRRFPPFLFDDEIYCQKLSYKTVYEHEVANTYADGTMIIKRCRVDFEHLRTVQKRQLAQFLHLFAS